MNFLCKSFQLASSKFGFALQGEMADGYAHSCYRASVLPFHNKSPDKNKTIKIKILQNNGFYLRSPVLGV